MYLYGWDRVSSASHIFAGILVALSGAASAIFVVIANSWMNTPTGFSIVNGVPSSIDPIAAMMNPSAFPQALHMVLAAYAASLRSAWSDAIRFVTILIQVQSFGFGQLDLRYLCLHLSACVLALYLAVKVLEVNRGR